jgi:hypothetical protein
LHYRSLRNATKQIQSTTNSTNQIIDFSDELVMDNTEEELVVEPSVHYSSDIIPYVTR